MNSAMSDFPVYKIVFLSAIALFTVVTAWTDLKSRKIYNKVTLPMWIADWVYQAVFHQTDGLLSGLYGFGVGFGLFYVLWMIGSAGGGDVKLIGALSVWLGPGLTLKVMLASLIFVVMGTFLVVVGGVFRQGWRKTQAKYSPKAGDTKRARSAPETVDQKSKRRVMAFAMPVALATWSVLILFPAHW